MTNSNNVNVGLLGAGFMGALHLSCYRAMNEVQYIAVCDKNIARANKVASRYGAQKVYDDYQDLLNDDKLDIIDICVPTPLHPSAVVQASERNKNILCEKPIALNLEDADRMIGAAKKANVKFMIAHVLRFWPEYTVIKQLIDAGDLGRPLLARLSRSINLPKWWEKPEEMGGAVIDVQIHDLDYACWMFGKPRFVFAQGAVVGGSRDHVITTTSHDRGTSVVEASVAVPDSFPFTMELRLLLEEGLIELGIRPETPVGRTLTVYKPMNSPGFWGPEYPALPQKSGFMAEIEHFVRCVIDDAKPVVVTPEDARLALAMCLASKQSMETGKVINF